MRNSVIQQSPRLLRRMVAEPLLTGVTMIRKQAGGIVPVPKRNPKDTFRRHLIMAHPMPIIRTAQPRGKPESLISGEGKLAMARIWIETAIGLLASLKVRRFRQN